MARPPRLKVYRTPIGFHDAYVAAPSQKAALQAWGSERDLFARGIAELVTDAALTAEPLARPGEVIRRSRGSAAEQIAALPKTKRPAKRQVAESDTAEPAPARPAAKPAPPPKPDHDEVTAAEAALAEQDRQFAREERALAQEEARLARQRRDLERQHAEARKRLEDRCDRAERTYAAALKAWRAARA